MHLFVYSRNDCPSNFTVKSHKVREGEVVPPTQQLSLHTVGIQWLEGQLTEIMNKLTCLSGSQALLHTYIIQKKLPFSQAHRPRKKNKKEEN